MNIIGIEVIRRNPGVATIEVPVGETLPVAVGDTVRVHMTVDYRGDAIDGTVWTAIGWQIGIIIEEFIEVFNSPTPVHFDQSADYVTYPIVCDVPITDISGFLIEFGLYGNVLDMYAKIMEVPGPDIFTDILRGTIEVVEVAPPPEYELIQHTIHPAAYVYEDEAEICTIEFPLGPEQVPFTQWGGLRIAEAFANAVEAEGNTLLEVKVYEDATPLLWTNYRVEIKAAVASEGQGVAVWPWLIAMTLPWGKIILGVLGILGIWVAGWVIEKLIKTVDRVIHKPSALTDEVIDALGREDLIPMILYKAPRVEYEVTPEELEAMSDDGLRALLKELRDRQVREEMEWWPLALIAGVGILGVGAAVALATARRK
ncbi:hypothetical protein ES703_103969 [subsurface metagenome]